MTKRCTGNGRESSYDPEQDYVDTPTYKGPCRRVSSDAERAGWREKHPDDRPWHANLPRPVLVTAVLALLGVLGWFEARWRDSVEERLTGFSAEIVELRRDWLQDARRAAQRDGDPEYVRRLDERLRALEARTKEQP